MAMKDVMLDLETLGVRPNAAVFAIGAVKFGGGCLGDEFYARIDVEDAVRAGLVMDVSTVRWWMRQGEEARGELESGEPLCVVLVRFAEWLGTDARVWGNGANFDQVILREAYRAAEIVCPLDPFLDRCYRTLKNLRRDVRKPSLQGTAHNALDDAKAQAVHAMLLWSALGLS